MAQQLQLGAPPKPARAAWATIAKCIGSAETRIELRSNGTDCATEEMAKHASARRRQGTRQGDLFAEFPIEHNRSL